MNVKEVLTKLKVMLSAENVLKFAEATLVDGSEVYTEGELEVGAILFIRAGEGDEDPMAPQGKHELTTGEIVTVGENGEITEIETPGADADESEEATEEEMEEIEVPVEIADEAGEEAIVATEDLLVGIAALVAPFTEEIATLKEEVIELTKRFEKMAAEPAATKVKSTFSEVSVKDARINRLAQLRNNK
tara:strand:+ start:337 stop:906 length:570 start_codon:yes stop_codon:yes gene_type:complete